MVFVVGIVVALFLLIYLVPKFSRIYEDMNTDLPFLSRMLLKWGSFASDNMSLVLLGIGGITALVVYAASNAEARARAEAATNGDPPISVSSSKSAPWSNASPGLRLALAQ